VKRLNIDRAVQRAALRRGKWEESMDSTVFLPFGKSREDKCREMVLDASIFEDIFETHYKRVYNFVAYRVSNHYDVEDMVSAVFEKVIAKYHKYDERRAPMEAWIISIAKNVVNDYFRRKKMKEFLSLDFIRDIAASAGNGGQPEEILMAHEENAALMKALNTLTDKERTIIAMKFAAGLKNTDIAALMSLSETNVGIIIHRCMKKMRGQLEGE
jgi:RNA polymerase sigma-70 factor (ECF subfamily)